MKISEKDGFDARRMTGEDEFLPKLLHKSDVILALKELMQRRLPLRRQQNRS